MSESKLLSIHYDDPHPVHKTWFEEVGDIQRLEIDHEPSWTNIFRYVYNTRRIGSDYDFIICEEGVSLRTALVKKLMVPNTKVIRLVADQKFYECQEKNQPCLEETLKHKFVDSAICVSEFTKKYAEEFISGKKEIVNPYVPSIDDYLSIKKRDYDTSKILFIGENNPNKNVDALASAVSNTDFHLDVIGKGHREYRYENVETHGYVNDIVPFLREAELYIQPSDGDAFPVASLEAMASGVPAIISERAGTSTLIEDTYSNMVCEPSEKGITRAIKYYSSLDEQEKEELGNHNREKVKHLTKSNQIQEFKSALNRLIIE